jgi:chorismate mutase
MRPRDTRGMERGDRERREIDELRRRIDELDERLVRLLNERAGCALSVGRLKEALGIEIFQPEREREVLRHVRELNGGPLDEQAIVRLFERIIDENRRLERVAQGKRKSEL